MSHSCGSEDQHECAQVSTTTGTWATGRQDSRCLAGACSSATTDQPGRGRKRPLMGPAVTFFSPKCQRGRVGLGWPPLGQASARGRLVGREVIPLLGSTCRVDKGVSRADTPHRVPPPHRAAGPREQRPPSDRSRARGPATCRAQEDTVARFD